MSVRVPVRSFTHGYSGYRNYGCRCATCRAGNVEAMRRARERRRALIIADPTLAPHGTLSTYCNWRCRCDECKAAAAERSREYRRERIAADQKAEAVTRDRARGLSRAQRHVLRLVAAGQAAYIAHGLDGGSWETETFRHINRATLRALVDRELIRRDRDEQCRDIAVWQLTDAGKALHAWMGGQT